jgi:hypothetical protein
LRWNHRLFWSTWSAVFDREWPSLRSQGRSAVVLIVCELASEVLQPVVHFDPPFICKFLLLEFWFS